MDGFLLFSCALIFVLCLISLIAGDKGKNKGNQKKRQSGQDNGTDKCIACGP